MGDECFPTKMGNRARLPGLSRPVLEDVKGPVLGKRERRVTIRHASQKGRNETFSIREMKCMSMQKLQKEPINKGLLQLTMALSKFAGYKVSL